MKKVIFFALSVLVMTSCVSKKQYQEAVDARNAAEAKYNEQSLSLRECETNNKNYERMLTAAQREMGDLKTANSALQASLASSVTSSGANISKLVDEINACGGNLPGAKGVPEEMLRKSASMALRRFCRTATPASTS